MSTDRILVESDAALVGIDSLNIGDTEGDARPTRATLPDAADGE